MKQIDGLDKLINALSYLPNVGKRTAQRYAYAILQMEKEKVKDLANAIIDAKENIHFCQNCGNFTDQQICSICQTRNNKIICVVKEPKDVIAFEKIGNLKWQYHVLHGTISPLENRGPNDIKIKELIKRLNGCEEVIMATNPDVEGEATAFYIANLIKPFNVKVTRLSQGISLGSDIEYADEITLSKALEYRKQI